MRILFLVRQLPWPPVSGARLRDWQHVRAAARIGQVDILSIFRSRSRAARPAAIEASLGQWCALEELESEPGSATGRAAPVQGLNWLDDPDGHPSDANWNPVSHEHLRRYAEANPHDLVVIEDIALWRYRQALPEDACVVLDHHNIQSDLDAELATLPGVSPPERARYARASAAMRRRQMQAAPALHLVCSEAERHKLAALLPSTARICVIENTIDVNAAGTRRRVDAGHDSGPLLFFPGVLNYPPNRDAVTRLVSAILPGVQQTLPGARLSILGRGSAAIEESVTRSPSVRFAGEVEDVSPYFAAATLMCVPLRAGGGTRFKILEAFAWRLPVVSTPKGCENLNVTDGEHLMIADTDAEIINAVIAIHDSEELRKRLAHNGHELVCSQYSHEVVHKKFFELIQYITKGI